MDALNYELKKGTLLILNKGKLRAMCSCPRVTLVELKLD